MIQILKNLHDFFLKGWCYKYPSHLPTSRVPCIIHAFPRQALLRKRLRTEELRVEEDAKIAVEACQGDQSVQQTLPYEGDLAAAMYVEPKIVAWDDSRNGFSKGIGSKTLELPGHSQDEEHFVESQWRLCDSQPTASTAPDSQGSQEDMTDENLAEKMAALQVVQSEQPTPALGESVEHAPTLDEPTGPSEPQELPPTPADLVEPQDTPEGRVDPKELAPTLLPPEGPVDPKEPAPTLLPEDPVDPKETEVEEVPADPEHSHPTKGEESEPEEPAPRKVPADQREPEEIEVDSDLEVVGATVAKSLVLSKLENMHQQGLDLEAAIGQLRSENWEKTGPAPVVPRTDQFKMKDGLPVSKGKGKGKGRGKGKGNGKGKGKGKPAKAKAKAKASAKAKAKAKARANRKRPEVEQPEGEEGLEDHPEVPEAEEPVEGEKPVEEKPVKKKRKTPPKAKVSEDGEAQVDAAPETNEPKLKSFARRPCPVTSPAKDKWHAIRSTYKSEIYQKVKDANGTPHAWEDWS